MFYGDNINHFSTQNASLFWGCFSQYTHRRMRITWVSRDTALNKLHWEGNFVEGLTDWWFENIPLEDVQHLNPFAGNLTTGEHLRRGRAMHPEGLRSFRKEMVDFAIKFHVNWSISPQRHLLGTVSQRNKADWLSWLEGFRTCGRCMEWSPHTGFLCRGWSSDEVTRQITARRTGLL
jgi:hypothetical protein